MIKSLFPILKRTLRFCIFGIIALITILALALSWISFSGRVEWNKTKKDLLASGEQLSLADLVPPPVPDEQNFFADPMWRELIEYVSTKNNGKTIRKLKIPGDQSQLYILNKPLAEPELNAVQKRLSKNITLDASLGRTMFADRILTESRKTANVVSQKNAATIVLDILQPLDSLSERVHTLLLRPKSRFPIEYGEIFTAPVPHLSALMVLSWFFTTRAEAALIAGNSQMALTDTLDAFRLANTIEHEPLLISYITRVGLIQRTCRAVNTGITLHAWENKNLVVLQEALTSLNLIHNLDLALCGERSTTNSFFLTLQLKGKASDIVAILNVSGNTDWSTSKWKRMLLHACSQMYLAVLGSKDQAFYNNAVQQLLNIIRSENGLDTSSINQLDAKVKKRRFLIINTFAFPTSSSFIATTARIQDQAILTLIACALERYWLENKTYPASLDLLVPKFISKVPRGVIIDEIPRYRAVDTSHFQLWFAGWDGIDNNGSPSASLKDIKTGDWLWNQP